MEQNAGGPILKSEWRSAKLRPTILLLNAVLILRFPHYLNIQLFVLLNAYFLLS